MPQVRLDGESTPVILEFRCLIDPKVIDEIINATGEEPAEAYTIAFDLREVPPHLRARLRQAHAAYMAAEGFPVVRGITEDPEEIANAAINVWRNEQHAAQVAQAEKDEREEAARAEEEVRQEAMFSWIALNGSIRLQMASERGYNVRRLYAVERAAKDLPGFWVDFSSAAKARARANPSLAALEVETELDAYLAGYEHEPALVSEIVWLTAFPRDMDRHLEDMELPPEQLEALAVHGWLGRYTVYLPIESAFRAPQAEESE